MAVPVNKLSLDSTGVTLQKLSQGLTLQKRPSNVLSMGGSGRQVAVAFVASFMVWAAPQTAEARGPSDSDLLAPLSPAAKKGASKRTPATKPSPGRKTGAGASDPLSPLARTRIWVKVPHGTKGATLSIDDRDLGALPVPKLDLPAGDHLVVVRRPGFLDFTRQVSLLPGQTVEVSVAFEPAPGTLSVFADVDGAQVFINGRAMGTTPVSWCCLPASKSFG